MNINEPQAAMGFNLPGFRPSSRRITHRSSSRPGSLKNNRLPLLDWLPDHARNHFVAMSGEFAGTFLFLFFAFAGTQVANTKAPGAVTLGMCLVGALPWSRGAFLTVAQILGGIASAGIVEVLFPGPLNVRTALLPGCSVAQGLFIEMFLSAQLVFTIFMLAAEKHKGTFIAPVGIGLSLFVAELTGVYYTGGSVNPARSFGPCVILHSFYHYHWIYWLGPILGALLASGFYKFIKMLEYETANPGQDFDEREQEFFDPTKDTSRPIVNFASDGSAFIEEGGSSSRPDSGLPDLDNPGPSLEQPPPVEEREQGQESGSGNGRRRGTSAMKGGRASRAGSSGEWARLNESGGAAADAPDIKRYSKGPDAEAGRALPRDAGRS
ncbi:MAG: hypothetical protein Q9212_003733 [Teloschistes hypoglaucus]